MLNQRTACYEISRSWRFEHYNNCYAPVTKVKDLRKFITPSDFYFIQNNISLRSATVTFDFLFLIYYKGKCTCQRIEINKLASMEKYAVLFIGPILLICTLNTVFEISVPKNTKVLEFYNRRRRLYWHFNCQDHISFYLKLSI